MKTIRVFFLCSALIFSYTPFSFASDALSVDSSEIISISPISAKPKKLPAVEKSGPSTSGELEALRKRASSGTPEDQLELGLTLLNSPNGAENVSEAVSWIEKAASQNIMEARTERGRLHREGIGGPKNYFEAVRHFRAAADAGFQWARIELGYMYFQGKGVHKDALEAFVLLNLASPTLLLAPENEYTEERTALLILEKNLTQDQKELALERMFSARDQSLADLMRRRPGKPDMPSAPLKDTR